MTTAAPPAAGNLPLSVAVTLSLSPLPPAEAALPTITPEPWIRVSEDFLQLEGLCFDRAGALYFCEVFGGRIYRLDPGATTPVELFRLEGENPASVKIHRDGRLYICCLGDFAQGHIFSCDPDGRNRRRALTGPVADDLVFAADGSFYYTDFIGTSTDPRGGVYRVDPAGQQRPVLEGLAGPNGVALSPDGRMLWVTETNRNQLQLVELMEDGVTIAPYGTCIPYRFTGYHGPDSCSIDAAGNLYVAMYGQGRVMVFNRFGHPLANYLLPGRDAGRHLRTTHPMMRPGSRQLVICSNDHTGGHGSWLWTAPGLDDAFQGYQFA